MHLPVVVYNLSLGVYRDACVPRIRARRQEVRLHDAERAPYFLLGADPLERRDFRAVECAEDGWIHAHCQAVDGVLGKED